jgi:zinc transport system ATP-binding protein
MSTEPAICIKDLTFGYDERPVLEHVNLDLNPGDFAAFIGPNGSGKTTLARLILGLLEPWSGTITVFGKPPHEGRQLIGYVPQQVQLDLKFPVTVLDVVLMGRLGHARALGGYAKADRRIAMQALEEVQLPDRAQTPFADLSGGQRQRTIIARALASQPQLLLLDEPLANVDTGVQGELYDLLRALNARLTIVLVTHDIGVVSQLVRTVVCINRTVSVHPTREFSGQLLEQLYGHPITFVAHDHHHPHTHEHGH